MSKSDIFSSFEIDDISEFAIALPKNSPLKEEINKAIIEMEADGTMKALQQKWGVAQ
jgi:ABC-type amino acid transport substrate-binding protein